MLNFPKVSEIRFTKLIIHSIFVVVVMTLLTLFSKDLVGLAIGHPIQKDISYISTVDQQCYQTPHAKAVY